LGIQLFLLDQDKRQVDLQRLLCTILHNLARPAHRSSSQVFLRCPPRSIVILGIRWRWCREFTVWQGGYVEWQTNKISSITQPGSRWPITNSPHLHSQSGEANCCFPSIISNLRREPGKPRKGREGVARRLSLSGLVSSPSGVVRTLLDPRRPTLGETAVH
jgi:hypothetical protein